MSENGGRLPPQVIRRGDRYVLLNVPELDSLTPGQRAGIGAQVWDQVVTLMTANGQSLGPKEVTRQVAEVAHCGRASAYVTHLAVRKHPELLPRLLAGELLINDAIRQAGFKIKSTLEEGRPSGGKYASNYFGKGDKFDQALEPMRRYLKAWQKRAFEFRHVNPAEAKRRLRRIDEAISLLQEAREDLVRRSHVATLSAPSEKRKGKGK